MDLIDFSKPKYLLCELPIKDGSYNDNRLWVYAVNNLSLIECINVNGLRHLSLDVEHKNYKHNNERWVLAFVQNNAEITDAKAEEVLDGAWTFLKEYLEWEDANIDEDYTAKMN